MLLVSLFFVSLLSTTLGAPSATVHCIVNPERYVHVSDCSGLLTRFTLMSWVQELVTYGTNQPPPGNVPRSIFFGTCELALKAVPSRDLYTEELRLIDYLKPIQQIYIRCLQRGPGFNGGLVSIGRENRFYVVLGAVARNLNGRNDTISTFL